MTLLLAYAYNRPFLQPLPVWDYWPALLVPLLLAVAIVYKSTKVTHLKELPWASVVMVFWVLCAFIGIAVGLSVFVRVVQ